MELFPEVDADERGLLDVGDGNRIYWEAAGNVRGKPAVVVHGGPGIGSSPRMRRAFDLQRFRVVTFDQRGVGLSEPSAGLVSTDLRANTTAHLVADMEQLREHLGIERWLVSGGSWGSALALAYAERFPERVSALVLCQVFLARDQDIDWLYGGVSRFFPEEWQRFREGAPEAEPRELVAAYARLMDRADAREEAAQRWARWEDAVVGLEPQGRAELYRGRPADEILTFVRVCAHYFAHRAWLEPDQLLGEAHRLQRIPGAIIHGRLDLSCPLEGAYALSKAWPGGALYVAANTGHQATPEFRRLLLEAHARFA